MKPEIATPEVLLAHAGFVSGLARGLVFGQERAEDVVQETLLYAIAHPPAAGPGLRSWLTKVARNVVRQDRRSRMRVLKRELAAARSEVVPSPEEIAEREEIRRRVVEAVLRLDDPYRTAIVLRYLEEEPPRAIARRLRVPVETVRTWVKRAFERLRRDLAREHDGDPRLACLALLPLARGVAGAGAGAAGPAAATATAGTKVLAGACLAVLVTAAVWFFPGDPAPAPRWWNEIVAVRQATSPRGALRLVVLDAGTGEPVEGARAEALADPALPSLGAGVTDPGGRVTIPGAGASPVGIRVSAEGYETAILEGVGPDSTSGQREVVIRLGRKR